MPAKHMLKTAWVLDTADFSDKRNVRKGLAQFLLQMEERGLANVETYDRLRLKTSQLTGPVSQMTGIAINDPNRL